MILILSRWIGRGLVKMVRRRRRGQITERRRMRMVAGSAFLARDGAEFALPITARSSVNADFPIPISRPVATGAKQSALVPGQQRAVPGFQLIEVHWVVAIEAVVISIIATMPHDQIVVFLRQGHVIAAIDLEFGGLAFLVARVAIQARGIAAGTDKFRRGNPNRRRIGKRGIDQGPGRRRFRFSPEVEAKRRTQRQENKR